ncbi:MAG: WD40-repeat-containing domain protein [Podila humilis]|nr:MAG: WD40-repeat-containing domain protein [Podila humilis]
MTLEQPDTTGLQQVESTDTELNHIATNPQVEYNQTQYDEMSTVDSWQAQTYQVYDCTFDPTANNYGISPSFSTGTNFNTTVGDSRLNMGIKDDSTKRSNGRENNYFKALKWSPDGTCLLSSSNDNCLRIFALPDASTSTIEDTQLTPGITIREGEVIYDMCWYPGMTTLDPATCCVLSSSRDHPVHLWDAFTGELRCSYTIVDHCEVNLAPNSLTFNLDGSKIYCGSNNMVEIFDTTRPGKDSTKRPTCPTRRSKKGQKGVISSLAFNPDHSNLYAAGSYLKTIGLYDGRADELLLLLRDKPLNSRKRAKLSSGTSSTETGELTTSQSQGQKRPPMGAVTQVKFTPDGLHLYSASRQDSYIRCWDIRNTAQVLHRIERPGDFTNQRLSFDISSDGKWLSTGDMNGDISIFNLENPVDGEIERLTARIRGHEDVISAAAFHPSNSLLATSSGQRKYDMDLSEPPSSEDDSESDSEDQQSARKTQPPPLTIATSETTETTIDNSIRLWSIPGEYKWYVNGQQWTEETVSEHVATEPLANDSVPEVENTLVQEDEILAPE